MGDLMGSAQDRWLLDIVANWDADKSRPLLEKLQKRAESTARGKFHKKYFQDAADHAFNKAVDWLMSGAPSRVSFPPGPWNYLLAIITNDIKDYLKKYPAPPPVEDSDLYIIHTKKDERIQDAMDKYGLWEGGTDHTISARERGKISLREAQRRQVAQYMGLKTWDKPPAVVAHIYGLLETKGWFLYTPEVRDNYRERLRETGEYLIEAELEEAVKNPPPSTIEALKKERRDRWREYNRITDLLEGIATAPQEQRVMRLLISGHKRVNIARLLDVTKSYISNVTKERKGAWGWDEAQIAKSRIYMLTHYLATCYLDCVEEPTRDNIQRFIEQRGVLSLRDEFPNMCSRLYNKVIKAEEMKPHFPDLRQSQGHYLLHACALCYEWWYAKLDVE
jgi:hypothetical protein